MALTTGDLKNISDIVDKAISGLATKSELKEAVSGLTTKSELQEAISGLTTKSELQEAISGLALKSDLDRMEARLVTAINLLQRDTYTRLDDHEARIRRLEEATSR